MGTPTYKELQKRLEDTQKTETHYKELTESIGDIFFALDKNLKYTYRNKAADKFSQLKKGDAIGKSPIEIFPDENIKKAISVFKEVLKTKKPANFINLYHKNGNDYYLEFNVYPSKTGITVFAKDISEKLRLENALIESEEKYRSLVERAHDGIAIIQDGRLKYVNPFLCAMVGYSVEELIGKPFISYIKRSEIQKVQKYYTQRMAGKKVPHIYESVIKSKNGKNIYVELNAGLITYQEAPAINAIVHDITDRKRAEETIKKSEERLQSIIESSPDAITITDLKGVIIECNKATSELHAFSKKEELIGKNSTELIAPKDRSMAEKNIKKTLKQGFVKNIEYTFLKKDGSEFEAELSASVMKDLSGNAVNFIAVTKDITDRKQAERELLTIKEELEERVKKRTKDLKKAHDELEQRVKIRTSKLRETNELLINEVNQRKKAEEILRQNEERYRTIFQTAAVSIWEEDFSQLKAFIEKLKSDGVKDFEKYIDENPDFLIKAVQMIKIVDVNNATLTLYCAKSKNELLGALDKIFTEESFSAFKETIVALAEGKNFLEVEGINKTLTGKRLNIIMRCTFPAEEEKFKNLLITVNDITDRKQAEAKLLESNEQLEKIFSTTHFQIALMDKDFNFIRVNPTYVKTTGYSEEFLLGKNHFDLFPGKENELIFREVIRTGKPYTAIAKAFTFPDQPERGTTYWDWTLHPFKDSSGQVEGVLLALIEVTGKKRAEDALLLEQLKLELLLKNENLRVSLASRLNSTYKFPDIKDEILKMIAEELDIDIVNLYSFDPLYEKALLPDTKNDTSDVTESNDTFICPFKETPWLEDIIKSGNIFISSNLAEFNKEHKELFKKKNITSIAVLPVKIGEKIIGLISFCHRQEVCWTAETIELFGTIGDIIASAWERHYQFLGHIEADKKQLKAIQLAERSARLASLGTLAAGIAHEINQPLNALKVKVDSMLYWGEHNKESLAHNLDKNLKNISEQADRIDEIIQQMRVLARQEKGKEPVRINVNEEIKKAYSMVKKRLQSHTIKLILELSDALPNIKGQPNQIEQITINLILNALNALDKVYNKNKEITISAKLTDNNVIIEVIDNGPGIPEDIINNIFDPFFTTKVDDEGMGLGLSIVQNIILTMGGVIRAENNEDSGARFIISIPAAEPTSN